MKAVTLGVYLSGNRLNDSHEDLKNILGLIDGVQVGFVEENIEGKEKITTFDVVLKEE